MRVLFLCTANSCRSQMAEGYFRALSPGAEVRSAGTDPGRVHPAAIRVMAEDGVDISGQRSKGLGELPPGRIDTVITLCADAAACPVPVTGARRIHWPIEDPAATSGSAEEILDAFRRARDEIRSRVAGLLGEGGPGGPAGRPP